MNERRAIALLTAGAHSEGALDYDDDVSLLGHGLVSSIDMLVEDVDFRCTTFSPEDIGHKAVGVALSDLAAAGASPIGFLQALALPQDVDEEWLQGYARGSAAHGVPLLGGDLSRTPGPITIAVTVFGQTQRLMRRRTALADDVLLVSGPLGAAAAGFAALERGLTQFDHLVRAQRRPVPRLALGVWLASRPEVHSMMDLSDGLAADLPRFIPNGMGAALETIPSALGLETLSATLGVPIANWLLRGGEDFELLVAVAPDAVDALISEAAKHEFSLLRIGRVTPSGPLPDLGAGYDHFAAR